MRPLPAVRTLRIRHGATTALCVGTLLLLAGSGPHTGEGDVSEAAVAARAFVITDREILEPFTFDRVVTSLTSTAPATWLETLAAPRPLNPQRRSVVMPLAGFIAALEDGQWRPAGMGEWSHLEPIAIVNRFDLAHDDPAHCGEYRLIFSRRTEGPARLHIAIEVALPNPYPGRGKAGCAAVAAFWRDLGLTASREARRHRLEQFFFEGLPDFRPVIDRHGFARLGRIRTSEVGDGRPRFRQYELNQHCATARPCEPRLTRVPLDNLPDAALFDAASGDVRAAAFRREFLRQVASLSLPDVNRYSMNIDRTYSVNDIEALVPAFNYRLPFRRSLRTAAGREFREQIAEELKNAGSTLRPEDIIDRAETLNCAGCHGKPGPVGGGVVFPKAFDTGEHIADVSLLESVRLSPALEEVFVPYRIRLLEEYLRTIATTESSSPQTP